MYQCVCTNKTCIRGDQQLEQGFKEFVSNNRLNILYGANQNKRVT